MRRAADFLAPGESCQNPPGLPRCLLTSWSRAGLGLLLLPLPLPIFDACLSHDTFMRTFTVCVLACFRCSGACYAKIIKIILWTRGFVSAKESERWETDRCAVAGQLRGRLCLSLPICEMEIIAVLETRSGCEVCRTTPCPMQSKCCTE